MTVSMEYTLTGTGWSRCVLRIDGREALITASYLSDCLADLLAAITAVLDGADSSTAIFEEEPGAYLLRLVNDGGRLRVRLFWVDDQYAQEPKEKLVYEAACSITAFAQATLTAIEAVLCTYGAEGYLERWSEHAFPLEAMNGLKDRLRAVGEIEGGAC